MRVMVCVRAEDGELGPFDQCALEAALRVEGAEVVAVSMGKASDAAALRSLLRLGVDRSVLLTDAKFAGADTLATAYTLSLAATRFAPDLILCGRQSICGDTAQVGPELAAMLGFPLIPYALSVSVGNGGVCCATRLGDRAEKLPALVTVERIHTLRLPSAFAPKKGVYETLDAGALNADESRCGLRGSPTRVVSCREREEGRRACEWIGISELPGLIRSLRKQRAQPRASRWEGPKLARIASVGSEVFEIARAYADEAIQLERRPPGLLAADIRSVAPDAVLWPADLWARAAAPQVAALLGVGICADCTGLLCDGKTLSMIRPARGGGTMATVYCTTTPQMATLRMGSHGAPEGELVLSFGLGARSVCDRIKRLSAALQADYGATRTAVDAGLAPYEAQIGLTGRTVAPAVYLALGIQGAIAHLCAVESAGAIIAVNRDRQARIFDYADYGIADDAEKAVAALERDMGFSS